MGGTNMLRKIFNKISYFIFHSGGYVIDQPIYEYDGMPYKGYVIYEEYYIFNIPGYDSIAICSEMEQLKKWAEYLKFDLNKLLSK